MSLFILACGTEQMTFPIGKKNHTWNLNNISVVFPRQQISQESFRGGSQWCLRLCSDLLGYQNLQSKVTDFNIKLFVFKFLHKQILPLLSSTPWLLLFRQATHKIQFDVTRQQNYIWGADFVRLICTESIFKCFIYKVQVKVNPLT